MSPSLLDDLAAEATVPPRAPANVRKQERSLWCWAACAEMVLGALEGASQLRQCEIATLRYPDQDCCAHPDRCNRPFPMEALEAFYRDKLRVQCRGVARALTEEELDQAVHKGPPVQIGYVYGNTSNGHLVLVLSRRSRKGRVWYKIADPELGEPRSFLFTNFPLGPNREIAATWLWTWYDFEKVPAS